MKQMHVLSAGAAQGLVRRMQEEFLSHHSSIVQATFGAVGAMKDRLLAGDACDVIILTRPMIDLLTASGHVAEGSARTLGLVRTGVAVREDEQPPALRTAAHLKAALLAAQGIYFPDPVKSTAGIHFMNVLKQLGVDGELAARLRPYPNGATAMRELAASSGPGMLGCTQVTEIRYTHGVQFVAPLPPEFELATEYVAAVCARAAHPQTAEDLVALLSGPVARAARSEGGFE